MKGKTVREEKVSIQQATLLPPALVTVLGLLAAATAWASLAGRGFGASMTAQPFTSIPVFHLIAEFFMAVLPAVGGILVWRGRRVGAAVVLFGFGTWIYAVAHAAAWAVVNDRIILIPLLASLVIAAFFGVPLIRSPGSRAFGPRTRWHTALMVVLVLFALQVFALWVVYFVQGAMGAVLTPRTDVAVFLIRDLGGELPMVLAALFGAWGWYLRARWGAGLTLVGLGAFFYAGVNNLGAAIETSTPQSAWLLVGTLFAIALARLAAKSYVQANP